METADLWQTSINGVTAGLPDRDVRTVRDPIHYQYAKTIARTALRAPGGTAAKENYHGSIKQTFKELHDTLFT